MSQDTKKAVLISASVLVLAAALATFLLKSRLQNMSDVAPSQSPVASDSVNPAGIPSGNLVIPEISTTKKINSLPEEFDFLKMNETTGTQAKSVAFKDGKNGYSLSFNISQPLIKPYFDYLMRFVTQKGWERLRGIRSDNWAFIEMQNSKYQGRMDFEAEDKNNTKTSIILFSR